MAERGAGREHGAAVLVVMLLHLGPDVTVDDLAASLDAYGYAPVEGVLSPDDVEARRAALADPFAATPTDRNFFERFHTSRYEAAPTRRLYAPCFPLVLLGSGPLGLRWMPPTPTIARAEAAPVASRTPRGRVEPRTRKSLSSDGQLSEERSQ